MRKIPGILTGIGLVLAGYLSMSFWDRLTAERTSGNATEPADNRRSAPVTNERSQSATQESGQAAARQDNSVAPEVSAAPAVIDREQQRRMGLRTMLTSTHSDLAEALGLTDQDARTVLAIVEEATAKAFAANDTRGLPDAERRQAHLAAKAEQESSLKALLGEQKFQEWEVYERGGARRQMVTSLRTRLQEGANPLSDEQSRALMAAVTADNALLHGATGAGGLPDIGAIDQSESRLLDAARTILSPAQFDVFETSVRQEAAMRRGQLARRAAPTE